MLVADLKSQEGYWFEEETLQLIPNNCYSCGSPLEINPTFTHLTCLNPRCVDKVTLRTVAMFEQLGVVDIGEPTIKKIIDVFNIDNPLLFYMYEPSDWESVDEEDYSASLERKTNNVYEQLNARRNMTLIDFIKIANLPNVQTSADSLFEGIETLDDFYDNLDRDGIAFIQNKLGIQSEVSLKSTKLYSVFQEFREDLFEVYDSGFITIIEDNRADVKIKAVCSDEVGGGFKRKADFYKFMDEEFGDKIYIDWGKSATKSMDVLIWAGADGSPARYTNKVSKTENWNAQGLGIPILTATQFRNIVETCSDGQAVLDTLQSLA